MLCTLILFLTQNEIIASPGCEDSIRLKRVSHSDKSSLLKSSLICIGCKTYLRTLIHTFLNSIYTFGLSMFVLRVLLTAGSISCIQKNNFERISALIEFLFPPASSLFRLLFWQTGPVTHIRVKQIVASTGGGQGQRVFQADLAIPVCHW